MVLFLATGLYMRHHFPASYEANETVRYLYRSNHLDILYAGLLNLAPGCLSNYCGVIMETRRAEVRVGIVAIGTDGAGVGISR